MSLRRALSCILILLASTSLRAQLSSAIPEAGMLRVLIKPEAASRVSSAFRSLPTSRSEALHDSLRSLLDLPIDLRGATLAPYIFEHSVAYPALRARGSEVLKRLAPYSSNSVASAEEKLSRWFTLSFDTGIRSEVLMQRLRKSSAIEIVEPVYARELQYRTNDTFLDSLYALRAMHVLEAWDVVRADSTIIVADVDKGVALEHPDLVRAIWHNAGEMGLDSHGANRATNGIDDDGDGYVDDWQGWDFAGLTGNTEDSDPRTTAVHGTETSGIMAASGDNGQGIVGVAFGARLMALKASGNGDQAKIVAGFPAIVYAADHGAKVINCSWGSGGRSQAEQDVIDYAFAKGSIVVAAAGNYGYFGSFYPASYDHVVSIASSDVNGAILDYGVSNPQVSMAAPGQHILTTVGANGYMQDDGTSMAAPNASGVFALVRKRFPAYTVQQAIERVRATLRPASLDPHPGFYGHGIVNAARAVSAEPAYSARITGMEIVNDDNHNGILEAGEHAFIKLHVTNYLDPVQTLSAALELYDEAGTKLDLSDDLLSTAATRITIGSLPTLGAITTNELELPVHVGATVSDPIIRTVKVVLTDSTVGYIGDHDYFSVAVQPGFRTLDRNNITVSVDNKGALGYYDVARNESGAGVQWHGGPATLPPDGRSYLYAGGIMIGADQHRVVDGLGDMDNVFPGGYRLAANGPIQLMERPNGAQQIVARFTDSLEQLETRAGVRVTERVTEVPSIPNAFLSDYAFEALDTTRTIAAGLYADWDISTGGRLNRAHFDTSDSIFYIDRGADGPYPILGMKLIRQPSGAAANFYAMNNSTEDGGAQSSGNFNDSTKWYVLTHSKGTAGAGDIAVTLGAKEMDLTHGAAHLEYAIAIGMTESDVRESIRNAALVSNEYNAVWKKLPPAHAPLDVWPDPANESIHISEANGLLAIYDMLGRIVGQYVLDLAAAAVSITSLPPGIYSLELSTNTGVRRGRFVKE